MLERITKCVADKILGSATYADWQYSFMAHPETLLPISKVEDPVQRFVAVTKFYLSGWHIKPPYAYPQLQPAHMQRLM